jgi:uncharacterized protein
MVKSPCIKDCNFDESSGICLGCRRTEDEFRGWRGMTDDEKLEVLRRIQREKECLIESEPKKT